MFFLPRSIFGEQGRVGPQWVSAQDRVFGNLLWDGTLGGIGLARIDSETTQPGGGHHANALVWLPSVPRFPSE